MESLPGRVTVRLTFVGDLQGHLRLELLGGLANLYIVRSKECREVDE
jgi:hypothetical protein